MKRTITTIKIYKSGTEMQAKHRNKITIPQLTFQENWPVLSSLEF